MLNPRRYFAAVTFNNRIYAIGGYETAPLASVEYFDPASNTWVAKADLLSVRHHHAAVVLANFITVIGGTGDAGMQMPAIDVYSSALDGD